MPGPASRKELLQRFVLNSICDGYENLVVSIASQDELEDFYGAWFGITEAGMKVQLADYEGWPFDDDNKLRKDWQRPAA